MCTAFGQERGADFLVFISPQTALFLGNEGGAGAPLLFSSHGCGCSLTHNEMQRLRGCGDGREAEEGRTEKTHAQILLR